MRKILAVLTTYYYEDGEGSPEMQNDFHIFHKKEWRKKKKEWEERRKKALKEKGSYYKRIGYKWKEIDIYPKNKALWYIVIEHDNGDLEFYPIIKQKGKRYTKNQKIEELKEILKSTPKNSVIRIVSDISKNPLYFDIEFEKGNSDKSIDFFFDNELTYKAYQELLKEKS